MPDRLKRLRLEAANGVVDVMGKYIAPSTGHADCLIKVPDGMLFPGLINGHDHLHRNHFGRLGNGPYANAYDWAHDIQQSYPAVIAAGRQVPRRAALLCGAWKNLLAGVTTVMHHDIWEPDFGQDFPLRVAKIAFADSLGMTPDFAPPSDTRFTLHLAEGVDEAAAAEVRQLASRDGLNERLLAVHLVGPDLDGVAQMRASGAALVWCPTSNRFLFGCTAPDALLAEGQDIVLGTDSLLTGAGHLLDELRAARGGAVSDVRLLEAVGATAAHRLGVEAPSLAPGARADIIISRRPLLDASAADIALVLAAGALRVLDPTLLPNDVAHGQRIFCNGVWRWISEGGVLPPIRPAAHHPG
jgi:cytosine/adenosine deaminase-related metal-dependent hydrolase